MNLAMYTSSETIVLRSSGSIRLHWTVAVD